MTLLIAAPRLCQCQLAQNIIFSDCSARARSSAFLRSSLCPSFVFKRTRQWITRAWQITAAVRCPLDNCFLLCFTPRGSPTWGWGLERDIWWAGDNEQLHIRWNSVPLFWCLHQAPDTTWCLHHAPLSILYHSFLEQAPKKWSMLQEVNDPSGSSKSIDPLQ